MNDHIITSPCTGIACDRSARTTDKNGYMHVTDCRITKSGVSGYFGREIPGYESLGLHPDEMYQVYRPAEELQKALSSFNNLPILTEHVPIKASDLEDKKDLIIGTTGTSARLVTEGSETYLVNDPAFWDQVYIDRIESNQQRELSACYWYKPIKKLGNYNGKAYVIVMTEINGNHVALVEEGRVGPDVLVADSKPTNLLNLMKDKFLKLRATVIGLAMDSKKPAVRKTAKELIPKLALDSDPEAIENELIDAMEAVQASEANPDVPEDKPATDGDIESRLAAIEAKLAKLMPAASDEDPAADPDPEKEVKKKDKPAAMDAAAIARDVEGRLNEKIEAADIVEPILGRINIPAMDSADDIYRQALKYKGIDTAGINSAGLKALVRQALVEAPAVPAMDSTDNGKLTATFPGLKNIK